jgi:hypothetical protein
MALLASVAPPGNERVMERENKKLRKKDLRENRCSRRATKEARQHRAAGIAGVFMIFTV